MLGDPGRIGPGVGLGEGGGGGGVGDEGFGGFGFGVGEAGGTGLFDPDTALLLFVCTACVPMEQILGPGWKVKTWHFASPAHHPQQPV